MSDSVAFVYKLITKRLEDQGAQVKDLQSRAATLFSATALATAFLGSALVKRDDVSLWFWAGLVGIVIAVGTLVRVLIPRDGYRFGPKPRVLVDSYALLDESEAKGHLSAYYAHWHELNKTPIKKLSDLLAIGGSALIFGLVAWAVELKGVM